MQDPLSQKLLVIAEKIKAMKPVLVKRMALLSIPKLQNNESQSRPKTPAFQYPTGKKFLPTQYFNPKPRQGEAFRPETEPKMWVSCSYQHCFSPYFWVKFGWTPR